MSILLYSGEILRSHMSDVAKAHVENGLRMDYKKKH